MLFTNLYQIIEHEDNKLLDFGALDIELQRECFTFTKSLEKQCTYYISPEKEITLAIMNDYEKEKYRELCEKTGNKITIKKITKAVINNTFKDAELIPHIVTDVFNPFMLKHVTKDCIYDKINTLGMDKLTVIDKQILDR